MKHKVTMQFLEALCSNVPVKLRQKLAIKGAKSATSAPFNFYVLRADGSLERYYGTQANKSGYTKKTIYPVTDKPYHLETYEIV